MASRRYDTSDAASLRALNPMIDAVATPTAIAAIATLMRATLDAAKYDAIAPIARHAIPTMPSLTIVLPMRGPTITNAMAHTPPIIRLSTANRPRSLRTRSGLIVTSLESP